MNLSAAGQFNDSIFETGPSVERSISRLPPTYIDNMKAGPNSNVDRTFFHAVGIAMVVATLTAGSVMVSLAMNTAENEIQVTLVSDIEDGG